MKYGLIMIALFLMIFMTAPCVVSAEDIGVSTAKQGGAHKKEESLVAPLKKRTTDEQTRADKEEFKKLEERLSEINKAGVPVGSYLFTKASTWLDFAFDEYTENDQLGVVEEALYEAVYLIRLMEDKASVIVTGTPIGKASKKVRPDLWDRVETLKQAPGFPCGGEKVAKLEVMLVKAGHEEKELGFRHAMPYIKKAEQLAQEASDTISAATCLPPAPAPARSETMSSCPPVISIVPEPTPAPTRVPVLSPDSESRPVPAEIMERLATIAERVHFATDESIIKPKTLAVLNQIASVLREFTSILVRLHGHTDSVGSLKYNTALSKRRAEAVKDSLIALGVSADRITFEGFGKLKPTVVEKDKTDRAHNRRVEFIFESDMILIKTTGQDGDLQIDK